MLFQTKTVKLVTRNTQLVTLLFALLLPFLSNAQNIKGYVINGNTQAALTGVNVYIDGTTIGTTTDENGFFDLKIEGLPMVLTVSYIGYASRKIAIVTLPNEEMRIQLVSIASQLPEAVVSSKPKIDTIYKERYSVIDYEFFDNYILLLVYRGVRKRYSVVLINENGEELAEESLGQRVPVGFYKGCLGAVYFLTGDIARQLYIQDEKIYFYKPVDLLTFERAAYPCVLSANDHVYFQNYFVKGQVVQYHRIHKDSTNSEKENFAMVVDEQRAIMAEAEADFQKMVADIEQFQAQPMGISERMSNSSFLSRVVFEPLYVPIFQLNDTLIIFNHRMNQIEYYQTPETIFKTVGITYPQDKKWIREIIRDEETQLFYTLSNTRWGYMIQRIDVQNGDTKDLVELERAFVNNIKIKGGFLYFLQNDFRNNDVISKLQKVRIE
jgi:hypothetical protein